MQYLQRTAVSNADLARKKKKKLSLLEGIKLLASIHILNIFGTNRTIKIAQYTINETDYCSREKVKK